MRADGSSWYDCLLVASLPDLYDQYAAMGRPSRYAERAPRGYYFVRQLLVAAAIAGSIAALYRNDVFRDLAKRAGQEKRYLAAEQYLVGSPGWGTPRSMEPVLAGTEPATADPADLPVAPPVAASPPGAERPAVVSPPAEAAAAPIAAPPAAAPAVVQAPAPSPESTALVPIPFSALAPAAPESLSPVSLDSLPVQGQKVSSSAESPAPARAAAAPRSGTGSARAAKVSLDDAPAPAKPKPAPKPAEPARPKATEARPNDNPLTAAIRGAVRARPAKDSIPQ